MEMYIEDSPLRGYSFDGAPVKSLKASWVVPLTMLWYEP